MMWWRSWSASWVISCIDCFTRKHLLWFYDAKRKMRCKYKNKICWNSTYLKWFTEYKNFIYLNNISQMAFNMTNFLNLILREKQNRHSFPFFPLHLCWQIGSRRVGLLYGMFSFKGILSSLQKKCPKLEHWKL